ncbi:transposase [Kocuria rosea]|uniref:transposase n=1 Tax=Kocuria rosea TaxID=1275 RepID=UPI00301924A7
MSPWRSRLVVGESFVLGKYGLCVVRDLLSVSLVLRDNRNETSEVYFELGEVSSLEAPATAVTSALRPRWDTLPDSARQDALDKLESVNQILTGYRSGLSELARKDEPWAPFAAGHHLTARAGLMAQQLTAERGLNREHRRRVERGEIQDRPLSRSTVLDWIRKWEADGLWGLVDKKAARGRQGFNHLDARYQEAAKAEVDRFDGDISAVSHSEVLRRIDARLLKSGHDEVEVSDRGKNAYVSWLLEARGKTPRSHRQHEIRGASGTTHALVLRPGQIVAIDATRADVRVISDAFGIVQSVEILVAIDVATRVILALRVVPMSADALDAGLLLYDAMRPFSQIVEGTTVHDWRWVGLPQNVQLDTDQISTPGRRPLVHPGPNLQGVHQIPGVEPDAVRCDHGSVFVSQYFGDLLERFGIDLLLSRGSKPTDNAFMERWNETVQACLQGCPGYKGRNTSQRGRRVDTADSAHGEELLTTAQFQARLKRWVGLVYHRTSHTGLELGKPQGVDLTPLEAFDAYLEVTGRLDVPQNPNLLYQFLPIKWGVIGRSGVRFRNMDYDARILDNYRNAYPGQFRDKDRAAPFFYDPHDVSQVWFSDPADGVVHPIPWRAAALLKAPMTEAVLKQVQQRIKARGGAKALRRSDIDRQILKELGGLAQEDPRRMSAADLRVDASRADHAEAHEAARGGGDEVLKKWLADTDEDTPMPPTTFDPRKDAWPDLSKKDNS